MEERKSNAVAPQALDAGDREAAMLEAARRLFAQPCRFVAGAASYSALPGSHLPEIAFAGRSNAGKSSLINALTGHRKLARISQTPGRTQQINFFNLGDALMLVDLPGYGYARASKQKVAAWTRLIEAYLAGRPVLRRVCLLIDARHGLKNSDRDMMGLLDESAASYQAVLTKADKLDPGTLAGVVEAMTRELAFHVAAHPEILVTSVREKRGLGDLCAGLAGFARPQMDCVGRL